MATNKSDSNASKVEHPKPNKVDCQDRNLYRNVTSKEDDDKVINKTNIDNDDSVKKGLFSYERFQYRYARNVMAIYMQTLCIYDAILKGTILKHRLKRVNCLIVDEQSSMLDKYSKISGDIEQFIIDDQMPNKLKFCKIDELLNEEEKQIQLRHPQQTSIVVKKALEYLNYVGFYFAFMEITLLTVELCGLGQQLGWIDCILAGRFIWRPEIVRYVKYLEPSLILIAFVGKSSILMNTDAIFMDCCDFIFSSEQRVKSQQINSEDDTRFASRQPTIIPSNLRLKDTIYGTSGIPTYDPTFHVKTNHGIVMKLNRNLESWKSEVFYCNFFTFTGSMQISQMFIQAFVVATLISFSIDGEILWYQNCNHWLQKQQNKTLIIPKIEQSIDVFDSGFNFKSVLIYHHWFGNVLFCLWYLSQNITLLLACFWAAFIVFTDSLGQCNKLIDELTRLKLMVEKFERKTVYMVQQINGQVQRDDEELISKHVDICFFHLQNYFESIRGYNEIIWRIYVYITMVNVLILLPTFSYWIVTNKPLDDAEQYALVSIITLISLIILAFLNYLRNRSEILYKFLAELAGKLPSQADKNKFGKMLTNFRPTPFHCFRLSNSPLTLMYGIKVSIICLSVDLIKESVTVTNQSNEKISTCITKTVSYVLTALAFIANFSLKYREV